MRLAHLILIILLRNEVCGDTCRGSTHKLRVLICLLFFVKIDVSIHPLESINELVRQT